MGIQPERAVFAAASATSVVGALTERVWLQRVAKPLIAPSLAAGVWRVRRESLPVDTIELIGALGAATVGDVLLIDPDDDRRLTRGAASFAAMQLAYANLLQRKHARPTLPAVLPRVVGWFAAAIVLQRRAPALAVPLAAYGLTLGAATTLASDPALAPNARTVAGLAVPSGDPHTRLGLGALLFTLSDALIVVRRVFLRGGRQRRLAEATILASYAGAQMLLVDGMSAFGEQRVRVRG